MKIEGFEDTIQWYNQNAQNYAQGTKNLISTEEIGMFAKLLKPNARVLDVGCSSGRDTNQFALKGFTPVGIDISLGLIDLAKKTYPNLNFIHGDMRELPFSDGSFLGVWAHASLLHFETIEDVEKALSEFNRVLASQGVLYVAVKEQFEKEKTGVVRDSLSGHDRFFRYFTVEEIKHLLEKTGFSLIEVSRNSDRVRPEVKWIEAFAKKDAPKPN